MDLCVIKCHVDHVLDFSVNSCSPHNLVIAYLSIFLSVNLESFERWDKADSLVYSWCFIQCPVYSGHQQVHCLKLDRKVVPFLALQLLFRFSVVGCSVAGAFPPQMLSNSAI